MKIKFLKKAAAFVTAAAMSLSMVIVLPEEALPFLGFVANAESSSSNNNRLSLGGDGYSSAYITENGDLYTWGHNNVGQLGDGTTNDRYIPEKIMSNVSQVSFREYYSACITTNGDLYTWGANDYGVLGIGYIPGYHSATPQKIAENVSQVSLGVWHIAYITTNGDLYTWGNNEYGQLGDGTKNNRYTPQKIMSNVSQISLGDYHSACITTNGDLYTWGSCRRGVLGDDAESDRDTPVKIMSGVSQVSLGGLHSACVTENGDLYTWGANWWGQLGDDINISERNMPVKIMSNVSQVSLGDSNSACITTNGDLYTWGNDAYGKLGDGNNENKYTPVKIMSNVSQVSLGVCHGACITTNGDLYTWGRNNYGQLGNGTTTDSNIPIKIELDSSGGTEETDPCSIGLEAFGDTTVVKGSNKEITFSAYRLNYALSETKVDLPSDISYSVDVNYGYVSVISEKIENGSLVVELRGLSTGDDTIFVSFDYSDDWLRENNALSGNNVNTISYNVTVNNKSEDDPSPETPSDNEIIISSDVNGDIIVEDGQRVTISGNVSCNNLYVKGGVCNIGTYNNQKSNLIVKNNVEITGGKTNWASPISVDERGGELNVYGKLQVYNNMTVGTDCGILNMTTPSCEVNVTNDFVISTNSDKYTCNLSDGILKIGGNFVSGTSWYNKHNFRATGNHLTIFYGNEFTIKIDKDDSYFNNLAFLPDALSSNCKYGLDTLYSANVKGDFYKYDKTKQNLSYLFKDAPTDDRVDVMKNKYKEYYDGSSLLKTDLKNKLGKNISSEWVNKISADTEMYLQMAVMSGANDVKFFNENGIILTMPKIEEELKFENVPYGNSTVDIYVELTSMGGIGINSSKGATCNAKWYAIGSKHYIEGSSCLLTFTSTESLYNELMQLWNNTSHNEDYWYWLNIAVKDFLDFQNTLAGVDVRDAKTIVSIIDKLYKAIIVNGNLNSFKINTGNKAADLAQKLEKIYDGKAKWITAIFCPVDVVIRDSSNSIVGSIVNNQVIISTDKVTMKTDGDKKYCIYNTNDKYTIAITATDNGTMDYIVDEMSGSDIYRRITFKDIPLSLNTVYTGEVECIEEQSDVSYNLVSSQGDSYYAISDIINLDGEIDSFIPVGHNHTLVTDYSSDETGHWYACSGCDEKVDFEAHTEDSGMITTEPTETTEGVKTYKCTKCRYVLRTEAVPVITADHTHNYEDDWKYDSNSHWHECACGDKTDIASHTSDGGTVTLAPSENSEGIITYKCNECDCILRMETIPATTPEHTCSYGTNWKYDSTSHWHECSCGNKSDISRHISNGGIVTVQPTSTTTGVKTYSCSVCGYTMRTEILPATGNNSENNYPTYPGYPTYPDYPTYPTNPTYTVSTTPSPNIFTEKLTVNSQTKSDTITLKWDEIKGADKYLVYYYKDGKYVKVKTTEDTSVTFRKLKNGKTYKFRVRYTINGKLSPISYSCEYTVTVYYKPIAKATATQNSVRLSWKKVPGAEKYAVYKYVDGKAVKLCETKKLAVKIKKLKSNKEYKYIVRAYVNGKWTTMTKSDIVTVTTE